MLGQAVSGQASHYLMHYFYAYALSREGVGWSGVVSSYPAETVKIMRTQLRKAIELNPAYPESYALLAMVNIVAGELDEAAELLTKVLKLSPAREESVMELGQLYLRQEKYDLAIQTLQPLLNARDRSLKKQAEILIPSIERLKKLAAERNVSRASETSDGTRREPAASVENAENQKAPRSESDYLFEALRNVKAGEQRIQGTFVKLDCDRRGVAYFTIQASDRVHKIRATVLDRVLFKTYVAAPQEMTCGVRKNPENVVLTYRPSTDPIDARARIDGDAVAVELVPQDFKLKK